MSATNRAIAKLCIVPLVAVAVLLPTGPSHADPHFVSFTGSGTSCTAVQPCAQVAVAMRAAAEDGAFDQVVCASPPSSDSSFIFGSNGHPGPQVDVDCPQGTIWGVALYGTNILVRMRGVTFKDPDDPTQTLVTVFGSGTLILENCTFVDLESAAFDLEPNGPLNLVIKNSRLSNNSSGILLKPAAGGSINATLDHVTITDNAGGGIRIDTTNGPVTLDATDSVISNNGGNGINALGNAGGQAIVSIKNSVIAKNGGAGVQANGVNAGVLIATTLLDQNVVGATSAVNGGNMFTYGNNQIVGPKGSGFTASAPLQ